VRVRQAGQGAADLQPDEETLDLVLLARRGEPWPDAPERLPAPGIDGQPSGEREDVGGRRPAVGREPTGVPPGPHECLLHQLLGKPLVGQQPHAEAEDAAGVALIELPQRLGHVAGADGDQQRLVGSRPERPSDEIGPRQAFRSGGRRACTHVSS
jgi:hypothetical protein